MLEHKPKIAVVVPTIREAHFSEFVDKWFDLFVKHKVTLVKVTDGDDPMVHAAAVDMHTVRSLKAALVSSPNLLRSELSRDIAELFSDHNPACRNLGFYWVAARKNPFDVIVTLDDDCAPIEHTDPIHSHLIALSRRWPLSWFSTTDHVNYMRGMPYGVRSECEAVVSHGLWINNADFDSPSDIREQTLDKIWPNRSTSASRWYCGPVPRGVFYPHCGMHVAFKREVLPYYYHCPVETFPGAERFDDIWMGIELKKAIDAMPGKCIVSGCVFIEHTRASNPFKNLAREAVGIEINETLWKSEIDDQYKTFFDSYQRRRIAYEQLLKTI